ncbi:unnamed protein product [Moneuplotes crassus]|uniref:Uncharacterized protein n=1 Tax=Euplotes crassus TaxID=5936 RepID=A0AAD1UUC7_EUPCR|nr:unnamed protein product [Moneuplotes crassus]
MENMPKPIEVKNILKMSLEKSILEETKEQDITRCHSIRYKIDPGKREIKPLDSDSKKVPKNSQLWFQFSFLRDMKLAKNLKHLKFFDINRITFYSGDSKNRHIVDFLESSFPDKTNRLFFRSNNIMDLNRSNYLNQLINLSSKVAQLVAFDNFRIGLPQMKRLVAAYKHVRALRLGYCKLSIPSVPDLSKALTNCQIQEINLGGSGNFDRSDWENNFDQFKNLVQGLASSPDSRLSIKKVYISRCGVSQYEAEQIFDENQFGDVKIIDG